ncbi:hypothetical protein K9N68_10590 [Kovacikia minuta CCNUW1]|uniref:hypothetical protein n=1 Tax=Kovacikia minuta TaxID=2931930 RepID=UPI001CCAFD54|nr:hypothetical protein [Kovacikia minuta]UBF28281.1 hypothetical protein K9N68_10590 [Kovacikia minuta CCNUW1]
MKLNRKLLLATAIATLSLAVKATPASAEQWYFWVKNDSRANIQKLLVSEDQEKWGYFEIGAGVAPGATEKMVWAQSTNSESCTQWIKAEFSDGEESEPAQFNFCKDLDEPIVFR